MKKMSLKMHDIAHARLSFALSLYKPLASTSHALFYYRIYSPLSPVFCLVLTVH